MRIAACVALLILFLVPIARSQTIPDDKLIVPGKRIGKWTLETTIADLERMNGPARGRALYTASREPFADSARDLTILSWDGILVRAMTVDQKTVLGLLVNTLDLMAGWQLYKTDKRIGLESTRDQVLKAYGRPTAQTKPEPVQTNLIYDGIGIAFRVWDDRAMRAIFVFRPGAAKVIGKF